MTQKNPLLIAAVILGAMLLLARSKKGTAAAGPGATNRTFYQSPAVAAQIQTDQNQTGSILGGIVNNLINRWQPSSAASVPVEGTQGEAAAAAAYQANPGSFQSPDPFAAYSADAVAANVSPSQILPNMGYVDNSEY